MVLGNLLAKSPFLKFPKSIRKGLEFLKTVDENSKEDTIKIDGDRIFAKITMLETSPSEERFYEFHRKYVDIQYVLEGEQYIYWLPKEACIEEIKLNTFDEDNDIMKFKKKGDNYTKILLRGNTYVVFFPDDVHKPGCRVGGIDRVKVCVVKVAVDSLLPE